VKILAVCGSPRRGNCYAALNSIRESHPDIDFRILMLGEVNLKMCRGCYMCFLQGEEKCPLKDDRDAILREIADADGVVFASPVYTRHVSALMKNFIDRTGFLAHRPRFFDKYAMVMAACGGFGADVTNRFMAGTFSVYGYNVVASLELYIATKSDNENARNSRQATEAFDSFLATVRSGQKPSPTITQLVYFHIFKAISVWNREAGVADYEYYKDKTDFFYDTKLGFVKKRLAKRIAGREVRKMMKDR
jgi:multimeric flavodoxin WrbA